MFLLALPALAASAPCPSYLPMGTGEVRVCAGTVTLVRGDGVVKVTPSGTGFNVIGLAPGHASVVLSDGRVLTVKVSACQDTAAELEGMAGTAGMKNVSLSCLGGTVNAVARGPVTPAQVGLFRQWQDAGLVQVEPQASAFVAVIDVVHLTAEARTAYGLSMLQPLEAARRLVDIAEGRISAATDGIHNGVGASEQARRLVLHGVQALEPGRPFRAHLGPTATMSGSGGTSEARGGFDLAIADSRVLLGGTTVCGQLALSQSRDEATTVRRNFATMQGTSAENDSYLCFPLNQTVRVAEWSTHTPSHETHTLPFLEGTGLLEDVFGGGATSESTEEILVLLKLVTRARFAPAL